MSVNSSDLLTNTTPKTPHANNDYYYVDVSISIGFTPSSTETARFLISRGTFATMYPEQDIESIRKMDSNLLMTLVCRELGFDDSHIWEVYARAGEEKVHPIKILEAEYDLIKKLEGGDSEQ